METITQEFTYADIVIHNAQLTDEAVEKLLYNIQKKFGEKALHELYQDTNPQGDNFVSFALYNENDTPYYDCEVEVSPGYPAKTWGSPENCYPGENTSVYCYDDTYDMLTDTIDCSECDIEIYDEEFTNKEDLIKAYEDESEPDPDYWYDYHKNEGY